MCRIGLTFGGRGTMLKVERVGVIGPAGSIGADPSTYCEFVNERRARPQSRRLRPTGFIHGPERGTLHWPAFEKLRPPPRGPDCDT